MTQEQQPQLQTRLKNILQLCIESLKSRLKNKQQMSQLQDLLIDYQNNEQLTEIIQNVLKMNQKINNKVMVRQEVKNMVEQEQYNKLEQAVQMLQAKQRVYIKNQNQLKLYCEELQAKAKQLEQSKNQLVISTKKVILDLKRDNQMLVDKIKALTSTANKQQIQKQNLSHPQKQTITNQQKLGRTNNGSESVQKLPKQLKDNHRAQNSLRSKLQQYHQVIQSIEASRGKKSSISQQRQKFRQQIK